MKSKSTSSSKSIGSTKSVKRLAKPNEPAKIDQVERSKRSKPSVPPIDQTSSDKTAKVQAALYEIASAASAVPDMQEFYAAMHRIVGGLMYAKNFFIALYDEPSGLLRFPYYVDEKDEVLPPQPLANFHGATGWVLRHGQTIADADGSWAAAKARGEAEEVGTVGEEGIAAPLKIDGKTIGVVFIQSYTPGIGYQVEDVKILEFVAQHIAQALIRARAIEETRQRNAELAIINSVQAGLVSKLDIQSIYDLVGDKIREIFKADTTYIQSYNSAARLVFSHYYVEQGQRGPAQQIPFGQGVYSYVIRARQSVLIGTSEEGDRYGAMHIPSPNSTEDLNQSAMYVPIMLGEEVTGVVSVQSHQPHAYTDSDLRLLQTLAASMSVALENVRLFDAEKQRAAELAIINSVQAGLASQLDFQAIVDLVGDQIRKTFSADVVGIGLYDAEQKLQSHPYVVDHGERYFPQPTPVSDKLIDYLRANGAVLVHTFEDAQRLMTEWGLTNTGGPTPDNSYIVVPLLIGDQFMGYITVAKLPAHAFTDSDVRLLQTLASSLSVALQNARSFEAEKQRAAELAIINSVQQGLAKELDFQAVIDLVGEKVREIFNLPDIGIRLIDHTTDMVSFAYLIDHGERIRIDPVPLGIGFANQIARTKQPVVVNQDMERRMAEAGSSTLPGTDFARSYVGVPILAGDQVIGIIDLSSPHDNAFPEASVNLLTTLAASLGVALQNARSFEAEKQRAAELAIINSVQQGLASKLEMQGIFDLVGDKIQQIFDAQVVSILTFDQAKGLLYFQYAIEKGKRLQVKPQPVGGFSGHILQTRQLLVINRDMHQRSIELNAPVPVGEDIKSYLGVPLMIGAEAKGVISLQNIDHENAFSESDVRLLSTLASSMSVALENVRLFDETTQRAAELAIINSVQQGLASKLDIQGIFELVGDKIREIFDAQVVDLITYDRATNLCSWRYSIEKGVRSYPEPRPPVGFSGKILRTRQPIILNQELEQHSREVGSIVIGGAMSKSYLGVPLMIGDDAKGVIALQNVDRENAFSEGNLRLLITLASSMSVALENARLFDETTQRAAELALINSVQEGLASKLDVQAIFDLVGDEIRDLFDAQVVVISTYDRLTDMRHDRYVIERGQRIYLEPRPLEEGGGGFGAHVIQTRQPIMVNRNATERAKEFGSSSIPAGEAAKSVMYVPLLVGNDVRGLISLQNLDRENAFADTDLRLLTTLANSMSVALENARLFDETNRLLKETDQRAAELAIINSVQQGLASKLDVQAIFDLVGDKIRDIFDAQAVQIITYDQPTNQMSIRYMIEKGERQYAEPRLLGQGFASHIIRTKQTLLIDEDKDMARRSVELGSYVVAGQGARSYLGVPLLVGDEAKGVLALQNMDREHAFSESDVRLLSTLASSMSVALENARLFDETTQRAAELALINSVQAGLASKLDMQSIYDLVGDKIRDIFNQHATMIGIYQRETNIVQIPYFTDEDGLRYPLEPRSLGQGLSSHIIQTREPLLINEDWDRRAAELGVVLVGNQDSPNTKSYLGVPIIVGRQVTGLIAVQTSAREHAYTDSDVRLLTTLASSMSVALENARLFDETNRLLKETDQRAAELSIINSVQDGLASKLEVQAVYDLVGDKIRDLFDAQVVLITSYDQTQGISQPRYVIEKGERFYPQPTPLSDTAKYLIRTRQPLLINDNWSQRMADLGIVINVNSLVPGTDFPKSVLFAPLIVGSDVKGAISLQNVDRENAFSDSDLRLLSTLASSMSVALENARLFDETTRLLKETDQRAAELAIINSVQQGLASKLDMQSIYDLVGDKIRDIFDAQVVMIVAYDHAANLTHFPFGLEKGQRLTAAPRPPGGFSGYIIRTRQPLLINQNLLDRSAEIDPANANTGAIAGEMPKSWLGVPLISREEVTGVISLQNIDRENAFSDSDLRLLTTLASSMSVALENARLFDETQRLLKETDQRAAELAIINSVQQGLASKLDMQSIYDLVGDKIRATFDAQVVVLRSYDLQQQLEIEHYSVEKGVRNEVPPYPLSRFARRITIDKQVVVINSDLRARVKELTGEEPIAPAGELPRSAIFVPLFRNQEVGGSISLQNIDHEDAFSESDVRLLTTLANSMSVALENARLFDETQRLLKETDQRAAELAIINSVQQGLASKLDMQSIYDLVGDKIRDIFDAQAVLLISVDVETKTSFINYSWEKGQRYYDESPANKPGPATPFENRLMQSPQVILINESGEQRAVELGMIIVPGTEYAKSLLFVPMLVSNVMKGYISLQNIEHEHAFNESDVRLLQTLANSMSVALENARLFDETQRLLKETDQRAAELALINSVQEGLASKLDVQSVYDLVGDKIRDIFDAQVVQIMAYDRDADRCHWRYMIEKGERQFNDPTEPRGFSSHILKNAQPLLLNEKINEWWLEHLGTPPAVLKGEMAQSYLGVPLIIGSEVRGVISLQNVDREHAFAEPDLRLLTTLASSMSVALENARLFDAERQRAQELEIINSVGEALASQLEMQAVYDLVGDKIRSIFDAQAVAIATYDRETNLVHYPYMIERGQRQHQSPLPIARRGFSAHIMQTRQPLMFNQDVAQRSVEYGSVIIGGGDMAKSYLGVPLIIGGEAKGVISLQNVDRENAFSDTDLRLLTTLSSSMGVALENARLFAETNRRASEMSALTDIGREISSTLELEAVIDRIAIRAQEVLKVGTSAVYLLEPDRITLRAIAAVGDYAEAVLTSRSIMGEGIIGSVAQGGIAEMIEDAVKDPRTVHLEGTPQEQAGEKIMVAPLFARDQVIGAMAVWRDPQDTMFLPDDLNFLVGLSRQAAIAIQNARLFEESQKRANETAALNEIGREISATLDINVVLERITQSARDLLIGDTSAVYLLEPDNETLNAVVAIGEIAEQVKAGRPKLGTGIVGNIALTGVPEFINNTANDPRASHIAGTSNDDEGKKLMVAPLSAKDRILGVMAVWRGITRPLFAPTDLDFLNGLARQAVIAINNARLFDEVQQQKQYSESLVQYSPVAIITMDLNNTVVSWNPGSEKLFGFKPDEAVGRNLDELITTEEQRVEAQKYSQQSMLGDRIHAITRRKRKDGSFVDVELSSVPVKMGGGQRSYVAIYHDITELQRAKQEAESANAAKSAFLATMSHEIRTPMNAIIGMSGLILDTPLNHEQREFAEIIRNSGDALLTIINDILDFSKIEAGKMEMESQPFDLRDCIEGTLDLIATRAFDKGLDLAYVIDEHVPPAVMGDVTRMRQIILNLLTNAVKFTEKGEVVLEVKPEGSIGRDGKPMQLHFTVRDTGIGIPPDRMSRLFQSFSQVDASTARKYGGTGLGLVISKRLSEMMGGSMWAISEGTPGKGATFHFTIKTQAADVRTSSTRRDLRGLQPPLSGKRILIVDDNETNRRILTLQTQKWGMQPRDTALPLQALEWIKQGDPFDVAILDMHMPEMDGLELAQAIRKLRDAKAVPLIMFTSLGRREGGADSIEFAAHLTKPIKPSQLFDALVGVFVEQPTHVLKTETPKTFDPEMAQKHPLRILLAEDNAVNQKLALRLLGQMGYRADVAGNGLEAIASVERQKYDVILMDVQMPEMDGLDATRAIVARWPKGVRPQIIAMTANAMQGDREMCIEAGMDDYMTKPIRIDELIAALLRAKPTFDQPQLPLEG